MKAFRLLGHLPAILKPDAQRALMLALATALPQFAGYARHSPHRRRRSGGEQFEAAELYWEENCGIAAQSAAAHAPM
ncbi:MAG: hypothetical protein R3A44_44625 [Caldilineaceae bacterium]